MNHAHRAPRAHRVAIVGAGATGIHASDALICMPETPRSYFVDLFDASPAPTGLIRFAAQHREAPDALSAEAFSAAPAAFVPRLRLFGNVRAGTDITIGELTHYYDTVVAAGTDSLTVVGTTPETTAVHDHLRSSGTVAVSRTPVVTEPAAADQPGAIVAFLESRGIPFTTWRGWHRPAWANSTAPAEPENRRNSVAHSSMPVQAAVTVEQWNALVASGLAIPVMP